MLRPIILPICVLALCACSMDQKSKPLTPDILDDQKALSDISNRLEPADREYFNRYVVNRLVGSRMFPDQAMVMPGGKDPATVGEAISLARAVKTRNDRIKVLEDERTAKLGAISKEQDAISAQDVSAYNAKVEEYNAVIEDYKGQIDREKARPLVLRPE